MELIPSEPPGNAKRKLRGWVDEIARLRTQGYSVRVIHETLVKAGIEVSRATVHRELSRPARLVASVPAVQLPYTKPVPPPAPSELRHIQAPVGSPPGEPIPATMKTMTDVDEFFDRHISNPLFRRKDSP